MVDDEQHHAQEEADGAHGDVGDAQEGVLAPHPGDGAEDHALAPLEAAHRVIVGDLQGVVAAWQCWRHAVLPLNYAVQLAESGECGRSHPDNEVLVDEAIVLCFTIQFIDGFIPVHRLSGTFETGREVGVAAPRVPELDMFVGPPGDAFLRQFNLCSSSIRVNVVQLQSIIKHTVGNSTTWCNRLVVAASAVGFAFLARMC